MTNREAQAQSMLQDIAKDIKAKLPEGMGFVLLAYEHENTDSEAKMLYVSNSNREDVLTAMVEFLKKNTQDADMFGKDV